MQRSERVNRDFPRYTGTSARRRLAFLLLALALVPQLLSFGTWEGFDARPGGPAVHAGETAADGAPATCELGSLSCAAAATAAATSVALLAPLLLFALAARPARWPAMTAARPPAFQAALQPRPPRAAFLPR